MSDNEQVYYDVAGKKVWVTKDGLKSAKGTLGVNPEDMANYIIHEVLPWGLGKEMNGRKEFTEDMWPEAVGWIREKLKKRYVIEVDDETDMISTFISVTLAELEDCTMHGY